MVFKRGKQNKKGNAAGQEKPERISNKLDHILVAESRARNWYDPRRLIKSRRAMAAAVLVALAVVGYFLFKPDPPPPPEKTVITSEGVVLRKLSDEELAKEIDVLVLQEKYASAEELINYQDNPNTKNVKSALASVYINNQKYQDAIRILQGIESEFGEDWQIAKLIAEQYQAAGNKQEAVQNFKRAIGLLEELDDYPLKQDEITILQSQVNTLEAQ